MALFLAASACGLAIGLKVSGKHMDITPALQSHADEKLLKHLNKYENFVTSCTVNLKVEQRGGAGADKLRSCFQQNLALLRFPRAWEIAKLLNQPDLFETLGKVQLVACIL